MNVTIPEMDTIIPDVEAAAGVVGTAGEAVQHRPRRHALGLEQVEEIVEGVADVQDQCEIGVDGEADLVAKGGELGIARRVLVVVVEAALPHPDQAIRTRTLDHLPQPSSAS